MELHLFSSPGERLIRDIIRACRPLLEDRDDPTLAYLPATRVGDRFVEGTEETSGGLARVLTLDAAGFCRGPGEVVASSPKSLVLRRASSPPPG